MFQQNGTSGSTNSLVKSCKFSAKRVTSIKFDTVEGAKNKIAIKINATEWSYPFYTRHPLSTPSPPLLSAHVTRTLGGRRHLTFLLGIDEACRLEVTTHHRSAVVLIISCSDSIAMSATRFTFG